MRRGAPWAVLENVVVTERLRRQGIGRALLTEAIRRARDAGAYADAGTTARRHRVLSHDESALSQLAGQRAPRSHGLYNAKSSPLNLDLYEPPARPLSLLSP